MFAENIEDIDFNNIIINEPIKNSVIDHSNFYKVIYSNKNITLNGLFCLFKLNNINIVKDKILLNNNNANNDNNDNDNNDNNDNNDVLKNNFNRKYII